MGQNKLNKIMSSVTSVGSLCPSPAPSHPLSELPPHSLCSTLVPNILRLTDSPQYSTHIQVTLLHWSFPNLPLHTPLLRLLMLLSTPHPDSSTAIEEDHPSEIT